MHLNNLALGGGTLPGSGDTEIVDNVSGIYGVRFSLRTDGADPSENPFVNVILANADITNGLVAQVGPQMLPNGADTDGAGSVWADYFLEGSVVSFRSPQSVEKGIVDGAFTVGEITSENPGRQMAQIQILRAPYAAGAAALVFTFIGNGYEDYLGEVTTVTGTSAQIAALPGAANTANLFIDEVGLYTVRDSVHFYDEDLCLVP